MKDTVAEGGVFTVTNPSGGVLPNEVICTVSSTMGMILQVITFNTSGNLSLKVGDKFGTLQVTSREECIKVQENTITINNTGQTVTEITVVDFEFDGTVESLIDDVPMRILKPGETANLQIATILMNICQTLTVTAQVRVVGRKFYGRSCQDEATFVTSVVVP